MSVSEKRPKPAEQAEQQIITGILSGKYPPDSNLPAERQLAVALGVTRPTLREVLQRLSRSGWLEIRHGHPTRVKNYMLEGSLSVLNLVKPDTDLTACFQELRVQLAPVYTHRAVERNAANVSSLVQSLSELPEDAVGSALYDWRLHYGLAVLSANPLYALLWMELQEFSQQALENVYQNTEACRKVRTAYRMIGKAARAGEPDAAEAVMRRMMQDPLVQPG